MRVSLLAKVMSFQKLFMKKLISAASLTALLPKDLFLMVSKNWFVVREKSGNLFYPDEWQTCKLPTNSVPRRFGCTVNCNEP